MSTRPMVFQLCVVVHDVRQANAYWAKVLDRPEADSQTIFPSGILHYTHGQATEYTDCQVAKYALDGSSVNSFRSAAKRAMRHP